MTTEDDCFPALKQNKFSLVCLILF